MKKQPGLPAQSPMLTANSLKNILWESMIQLKDGSVSPQVSNAMATNCREILRVVRVQLQIATQMNQEIPVELIEFSEAKNKSKFRQS